MFDELSVAENIFMGHMPRAAGSSTGATMRTRAARCSSESKLISKPRRRSSSCP